MELIECQGWKLPASKVEQTYIDAIRKGKAAKWPAEKIAKFYENLGECWELRSHKCRAAFLAALQLLSSLLESKPEL